MMAYRDGRHIYVEGREALAARERSGLPYWIFDAERFNWVHVDNPGPDAPLWSPSQTFTAGAADPVVTADLFRVPDSDIAREYFGLGDG